MTEAVIEAPAGEVAAPASAPAPAPVAAPAVESPAAAPAQPSEAKAPEGEKPAEAKPQPRAPEQYTEFTVPDALRTADGEASPQLESFKAMAKELDLSQGDAQKLVDFQAKHIVAARQQWTESAMSDPEYGGDKLDANMAIAKKAIDAFGTPELKAMLNATGIGNHPEIIRAFYRAGKAISDDSVVVGKQAPSQPKSLADRLYS